MSDYSDEDVFDYDDVEMEDEDSAPSDDDMSVELYNDDFKIPDKGKRKSYEVDHSSLSQEDVEKLMKAEVEHISGILGVDGDSAAILLRSLGWNKERLIEKYMDNATAVNVAAGLEQPPEPPKPISSRSSSGGKSTSGLRRSSRRSGQASSSSMSKALKAASESPREPQPFVCPICFDDAPTSTLSLSCDHQFCTGCWQAYVTSKVRGEGEYLVRCMAEGCNLVASDRFIQSVLSDDPSTWIRYQGLLARHFVGYNKNLKYCPYPECTYTVSCPTAASKSALTTIVPTVTCGNKPVGHTFCFGCAIEADHRPVICAVAAMWLKKCRDDSETANWIRSNTKECSKCQSTIEKNGGCNHMTCKKCKYEFCWVCMGPWNEHGTSWYSCNRYDEKASQDARDAQSQSRASLERYLHYYNRWANHEQSAKLSMDLYAKTEKKMEEMQVTSALTWIEVQFMKKAVDEVFRCRMTLKWTYAMAYYLKKGNEKELFEDNQRDLENAVEQLSELIESPIDADGMASLRQKVTDKTVYVQKRNEIMLEDTANGFLEDRWRWDVPVEGYD